MLSLAEATFIVLSPPGSPLSSSPTDFDIAGLQVQDKQSRFVVDCKWIEDCSAMGSLLDYRPYLVHPSLLSRSAAGGSGVSGEQPAPNSARSETVGNASSVSGLAVSNRGERDNANWSEVNGRLRSGWNK